MQIQDTQIEKGRILTPQMTQVVVQVLKQVTERLELGQQGEIETVLDKIASKSPGNSFDKEEK